MSPKRSFHSLEILESRIAPASLTFLDVDGETVTILTSKGTDGDLATAAERTASGEGFRLDELDLTAAIFAGTNVTITAEAGGVGDDLVTLGFLNALGRDLGSVTVGGTLIKINAGDAKSSTAAVKALTVRGFGSADPALGAAALDSDVVGGITTLTVNGDFAGAYLSVRGSDSNNPDPLAIKRDGDGKIGTLTINGSLIGTARNDGGLIETTGNIGKITVTGFIRGFIDPMTGGNPADNQQFSGRIFSGGTIASLTVGTEALAGGVIGGDGEKSGQVASAVSIGAVKIFGNVKGGAGVESGAVGAGGNLKSVNLTGNLEGGFGARSGTLLSAGSITAATIGGSILGGAGENSGAIGTAGFIGSVVITGDIVGGEGSRSGQVVSQGTIQSVTVTNVVGGSNFESGAIGSLKGLGTILIKGDLVAGTGTRSGIIATEEELFEGEGTPPPSANAPIGKVTVMGSVFGGSMAGVGLRAGSIISSGQLGPVVIGGDLIGGDNRQTGWIASNKGITSVTIGGGVQGGSGDDSGSIIATGAIGFVTIGADLTPNGGNLSGGTGFGSGSVSSFGKLGKTQIFGSVLGGDGSLSGRIYGSELGTVFIAESLVGGFGSFSSFQSGTVYSVGKLGSVTIGDPASSSTASGSIIGGSSFGSGSVESGGDMGPVKVKFNVEGGSGGASGRIVSGGKIASINIGIAGVTEGSLLGGSGNAATSLESGEAQLGQIFAVGAIGPVNITGSISTAGSGGFAIVSTFDTDLEGWTVNNASPVYSPSGGNPGGYLFFDNPETNVSEIIAPSQFLGDLSAFNGGFFSFDGNLTQQGTSNFPDYGTITIVSGSDSVSLDIVPGQPASGVWQTYSIGLDAATWGRTETEWTALLSNVTSLRVTLEGVFGQEQNGADNVTLQTPSGNSEVPSGNYTGLIHGGSLGTVAIAGAILGGGGFRSGGLLSDTNIGSVTVASIVGGDGSQSGFIAAEGNIGSVKIKGALGGGSSPDSAFVAAGGTLSSFEASRLFGGVEASRPRVSAGNVLSKVTISSSVADADILSGYDIDGNPTNPDAQIGKVLLGTSRSSGGESSAFFFGVNIVAGFAPGDDGVFGTFDDFQIQKSGSNNAVFSKIASVIVNGSFDIGGVFNSYGIIAQNIVAVKVNGSSLSLKSGTLNDFYLPVISPGKTIYGESGVFGVFE